MSQPSEGQDHLDYRETDDVTEVHAAVLREHPEPRAGSLPIPTWLGVLCTASLCWASAYVGMFHGGFSPAIYNEYQSNPSALYPLPGGDQGQGEVAEPSLFDQGAKVFTNCVPCHQASGSGNAQVPPLAGSEWVDGPEFGDKRIISIVLKGINGSISVKGQTFNGAMPAWEALKDRDLAGVLTYIRGSFGNKGTGEITPEMVKAVRKGLKSRTTPWTMPELKAIPTDAKIEGIVPAAPKPADGAKPADGKAPGAAPTADAKPAPAGGTPPATAGVAATDATAANFDLSASINSGKTVFMTSCMVCHQITGLGLPGAFPPLAKTPYVNGDSRRLVAIALKGILGAITVDGKIFVTGMPQPDTTFPQLKDDKNLADVLNYVRNNFDNKNPEPITPAFVAKIRKEFESRTTQWTEAELLNFPPAK